MFCFHQQINLWPFISCVWAEVLSPICMVVYDIYCKYNICSITCCFNSLRVPFPKEIFSLMKFPFMSFGFVEVSVFNSGKAVTKLNLVIDVCVCFPFPGYNPHMLIRKFRRILFAASFYFLHNFACTCRTCAIEQVIIILKSRYSSYKFYGLLSLTANQKCILKSHRT